MNRQTSKPIIMLSVQSRTLHKVVHCLPTRLRSDYNIVKWTDTGRAALPIGSMLALNIPIATPGAV
jgi:hypothetical protein